nr:dipeptidyl aminopeptidase 4-like [Nerophis lumbriciformis]
MSNSSLLACLTIAGLAVALPATSSEGNSIADPQFLRDYAETFRFRLGQPTAVEVTDDAVFFLRSGPRSFVTDLWQLDPATGEERRLLTAEDLLGGTEEELTAEEKARRERQRLATRGIAGYSLSSDGRQILAPLSGDLYLLQRADGTVRKIEVAAGFPLDAQLSPAGDQIAYVAADDLWLVELDNGEHRQLTQSDSPTVSHGLAEFVAQEEMGRHHGFWWSPDSTRLAFQKTDTAGMETFRIADPPIRPKRCRNGPTRGRARTTRLSSSWDRKKYPYLTTVRWTDNAPLTLVVQNRRQTELAILAVDPDSGISRKLLVETDDAWLNLDQQMPHWLADGRSFLWTSERDGAWCLEHRAADGTLLGRLTAPELGYRSFVHLDEEAGTLYVQADGGDPTRAQLYRLPMAGGPASQLSDFDGVLDAKFSSNGRLRLLERSSAVGVDDWLVTDAAGNRRAEVRSMADQPSFATHPEWVHTTVEGRTYHAAILRPQDFDPARSYPVVLHVYGGPHSQRVTRQASRYVFDQWMADHGYVVLWIDGRGTPHRGRAWERSVHHDLITLSLTDQVTALTSLGKRFPEMDLERRGDVFSAAVAGAPVADWLDYDTHYTERYMGLPSDNPNGYHSTSVLNHADKLERPLLIIHGTADDNVYFMHALKMSNALFRAGKPHDFLALAGFTHMVPDPLVTERLYGRIMSFFAEHLGQPTATVTD